MARVVLAVFWVLLMVRGAILVDVGGVDEEERVVDLGGGAAVGGADGGDDGTPGARGVGGTPPRIVEVGKSSCPRDAPDDTPIMEEGQGSGGKDTEDTFRDLPELSSGGRVPRLRQSILLETFTSSSQMGQPELGQMSRWTRRVTAPMRS